MPWRCLQAESSLSGRQSFAGVVAPAPTASPLDRTASAGSGDGGGSDDDEFHSAEEEEKEEAAEAAEGAAGSWRPSWLALPSGLSARHTVVKVGVFGGAGT